MGKDSFAWKLSGFKELDRMLQQLPKSMGKAVLRRALIKAARPTEDAMRSNAPISKRPGEYGQGNLRASITVSTRLKPSQREFNSFSKTEVVVYVGSTAPHAHLVEFGTGPRAYKTKDGNLHNTGQMPANPFARTAWESTKEVALKILAKELEVELLKAVKRLRTRAERGTLGNRAVRELLA